MISIFADKSTIVLRKMLKHPHKSWVIHDFTKERDSAFGIGQGRVQKILNEMERLGYIERKKRGAKSKALLTNSEKLIKDWTAEYKFERNTVLSFYSPDKKILPKLTGYLVKNKLAHALTAHTAANLYTHFAKTDDIFIYLQPGYIQRDLINIRQSLDLKQLVQGGNVHFLKPYYKNSVFFDLQNRQGYTLVSNLQLYLDLYNFRPRGREHAEYFKKILKEKGKALG